ncbi:MAG: alanine--tRNA ligase-related protein [Promethearchaeota archaeon]
MSEKLYWKNPYDTEFEANIVAITKNGLIFDRTLFYPKSGNQASDVGYIVSNNEKFEVNKVSLEGKDIIHEIPLKEIAKFKIGDKIKGIINWENRYGIMKAHSSQHIFSALIKNKYNINTSRAFIENEEVIIQFDKAINFTKLNNILTEFLLFCTIKNLEIKTEILTTEHAENIGNLARSEKPEVDQIRVVNVKGIDVNFCGGTHVRNSTEIGPPFLIDFKKNLEIKYLVGNKAIEKISQLNLELLKISNKLNTNINKCYENLEKLMEANQKLQKNHDLVINEFFNQKIMNPDFKFDDIKLFLINFEIEYKLLKGLLALLPGNSLLLIMSEKKKVRIYSNVEKIRSNELVNELINRYQGKGGGNPKNAQCSLEKEPKNIIQDIQQIIKNDLAYKV